MKTLPFRAMLAAAPLLVLLFAAGQIPASGEKEGAATEVQRVVVPLDRILQARFQEEAQEFGVARIGPAVAGHDALGRYGEVLASTFLIRSVRRNENAAKRAGEQRLLDDARRVGNDFIIGFLHIGHTPGQYKAPPGFAPTPVRRVEERLSLLGVRDDDTQFFFRRSDTAAQFAKRPVSGPIAQDRRMQDAIKNASLVARWERAAKDALPRLRQGQAIDTPVGNYVLALRPVRAEQEACLGCHVGAKKNETLGVLVYAVARNLRQTGRR
jgi:hypothetical protein